MDRLQTTQMVSHADAAERPSAILDETIVGTDDGGGTAEDPHPPGSQVGRYAVLERIGAGGMGVVLAARDPELDRKVALKILHRTGGPQRPSASARARLLREAQAIARVRHPNVVSVYDVGTVGEAVFVAMEFIDGPTLARWVAQGHDVRATVAMFVRAARGLAAAHAAGIVHRDFKPDNVLIGSDGHPRVLDFGLARADGSGSVSDADREHDMFVDDAPAHALDSPLTLAGAVVGTPRYMAPEQHAGVPADARCDQYAFCVALYQALFRQDPFIGPSLERLALAKQTGDIREPPAEPKVPAHITAAVMRGLAVDPAARFADMARLIAALQRDPRVARRRVATTAAVALLGAAAAVAVVRAVEVGSSGPCAADDPLAAIWDGERRARITGALTATGLPWAQASARRVGDDVDAYAARWHTARAEVCRRAEQRERSAASFDRAMACLDERRAALSALLDVLVVADVGVGQRAVQAVGGLPAVEPCADDAHLGAAVEPPTAAIAGEVAAARAMLAQARALTVTGRVAPASELVDLAGTRAAGIEYAPLHAEVALRRGVIAEAGGDYERAEGELLAALWTALRVRHDEIAAAAARQLVMVVGDRLARHGEGLRWASMARSLGDRVGVDDWTRADLDVAEANVRYRMGELEAARVLYERALTDGERLRGPDDPALVAWLVNLGNVHYAAHRREQALATFERARAVAERGFGSSHPNTAIARLGLANVLLDMGRHDAAEAELDGVLASLRGTLGAEHPFAIAATCNLGLVQEGRGELDRALASFRTCHEQQSRAVGSEHPDTAQALVNVGRLQRRLGHAEAARAALEAGLAIRRRTYGDDAVATWATRLELADLDRDLAAFDVAVHGYRAVVDGLARARTEPVLLARARFGLAQALAAAGGELSEATALAQAARQGFVDEGDGAATELAELDAWLRAHSP